MTVYQDPEGWNSPGIKCCWGWKWEASKSQFAKTQLMKSFSGCWKTISSSSLMVLLLSPIPSCTDSKTVYFFKTYHSHQRSESLILDLSWLRSDLSHTTVMYLRCIFLVEKKNPIHPLYQPWHIFQIDPTGGWEDKHHDYLLNKEIEAEQLIGRHQCPFQQHLVTSVNILKQYYIRMTLS